MIRAALCPCLDRALLVSELLSVKFAAILEVHESLRNTVVVDPSVVCSVKCLLRQGVSEAVITLDVRTRVSSSPRIHARLATRARSRKLTLTVFASCGGGVVDVQSGDDTATVEVCGRPRGSGRMHPSELILLWFANVHFMDSVTVTSVGMGG